jgi:hypothetical protein
MNKRVEEIRKRLEAANEAAKIRIRADKRLECTPFYAVSTDPEYPGIDYVPTQGATGHTILDNGDGFATPEELEMFANAPQDLAYLLSLFCVMPEGTLCPGCKHELHNGEYCAVCSCPAPIDI